MKKDLQNKGEGLMIYFTKKECQFENLEKGDVFDLTQEVVKNKRAKIKKEAEARDKISNPALDNLTKSHLSPSNDKKT